MKVFSKRKEYFKDSEFKNPEMLSMLLRVMLEKTRELAGVPMRVTSSWRPREEGTRRMSAHEDDGSWYHGVDIACTDSRTRYKILYAALVTGFKRIGVYDKHIHLDVAVGPGFEHGVVWWGVSK
jgi:hypothetical protein